MAEQTQERRNAGVDHPGPNILSLCTGIAGIELGLKLLMPGARTVCCVEREAYATANLVARMEDSTLEPCPIWCGDLADFAGRPWRGVVDIVTAGFPCQPWSVAGKQRKTKDERWIWPEIARIIRQVEPGFVFLENTPSIVRGGLEYVLGSLAGGGFDAEWGLFSAKGIGAPHKRERWFLLAYHNDTRELQLQRSVSECGLGVGDLCEGLGNPESIGAGPRNMPFGTTKALIESPNRGEDLDDSDSERLERRNILCRDGTGFPLDWPPGPGPERRPLWKTVLETDPSLAPAIEARSQSEILRVVDGFPEELEQPDVFRADRIRCLGNAVVPIVAAHAFKTLRGRLFR